MSATEHSLANWSIWDKGEFTIYETHTADFLDLYKKTLILAISFDNRLFLDLHI